MFNMDCSHSYTAKYLVPVEDLAIEWDLFIKNLNVVGCRQSNGEAYLLWSANLSIGNIPAKNVYEVLVRDSSITGNKWWYKFLWKWMLPLKVKCFMWLTLQNCLKTWDNLVKKGWVGPSF